MDRRKAISSLAGIGAIGAVTAASAGVVGRRNALPVGQPPESLPSPLHRGGLKYLSQEEATAVGAIFERLIPTDALGPGAVEAGCVVFVDDQLAGDYGKGSTTYRKGPFPAGTPQQGPQSSQTPAQIYRDGLKALQDYCLAHDQKRFEQLDAKRQDQILSAMEQGQGILPGADGKALFELWLKNVREGFFSDPLYGGNRDMVGWKLLGFPGARYDYREAIRQPGVRLNFAPVSMVDGAA